MAALGAGEISFRAPRESKDVLKGSGTGPESAKNAHWSDSASRRAHMDKVPTTPPDREGQETSTPPSCVPGTALNSIPQLQHKPQLTEEEFVKILEKRLLELEQT